MDNKFDQLQNQLAKDPSLVAGDTQRERTLVYVAGMSLDQEELSKVAGIEHYEERLLYVIGLLRNKKTSIVFITSKQIDPDIINYYFDLFSRSAKERDSMRRRWHQIYIGNTKTHKTLTQKILTSPRTQHQIKEYITNPQRAVLRCFNASEDEKTLAVKLNIPLFGPDPKLLYLGSKSGARAIFKAAQLKPPFGQEHVHAMEELAEAILSIVKKHKRATRAVLKFNYSFSGGGNATIELNKFPKTKAAAITYIEKNIQPNEDSFTKDQYLKKFFAFGGIVERWVDGAKVYSPSVQIVVQPDGKIEVVSTHEQILDEATRQIYLGACFPARKSMRAPIVQQAKRVGKALSKEGVIGPFSIDFMVIKDKDKSTVYPIEINLRKGGTTHPYQITKFVTRGEARPNGMLRGIHGRRIYYYSYDNIKSPHYIGLKPTNLIQMVRQAGLEFDPMTNTGITLHLLGAVEKYGKFGAVCISRSPRAAEQLFLLLQKVIDANVEELHKTEETAPALPVNRKQIIQTFMTLAKISSPSGQEDEIRRYLRQELVRLGVKVRVDKAGNLLGKKSGQTTVPLLLAAHMDTVQPCANVKPVVRGDTIMSDGSTILGADNKAGITYIIEALRLVQQHNIAHKSLEIIFTVNEEVFSTGAEALEFSKIQSPFGIVIDGADLGEVDYTAPYIATLNANIIGKGAHSGVEPEKGISAVQIAAMAIYHMKLGRLDEETTANIGAMQGGENRNAIPALVKLHGEVRSLSKRKLEEQLERMHKALEDATEQFGGLLELDSKLAVKGYTLSKTDEHIKQILHVLESVGVTPQLRKAGGASDANVFVNKGIKTIDVGTGVQQPHTVEEHIAISDMEKMTRFILEMMRV